MFDESPWYIYHINKILVWVGKTMNSSFAILPWDVIEIYHYNYNFLLKIEIKKWNEVVKCIFCYLLYLFLASGKCLHDDDYGLQK